jgi:hypothetical protein
MEMPPRGKEPGVSTYEIATESGRRLRLEVDGDCTHLDQIHDVEPSAEGCEECLTTGDDWVHLRLCRSCGHVGCCDNSKNRHATKHNHETGHAIIESFEPGEGWMYCYPDGAFIEPL